MWMNRLIWLFNISQLSILLNVLHLMPLSMQLKLGLDKLFSYMDPEELAKHMSITPYATSCVVREKLSFVWLLQAFKIPIEIHESSTYAISRNSDLAELICSTDLVIWDEAPMQHHHIHEAVDRTFQDIRISDKPFGGLPVVFGDFKQILPVIVKGSHAQIVGACIQRSRLWCSIKVLKLIENMHLNTHVDAERNFAKWQLEIGHGQHTDEGGDTGLPDHFKCTDRKSVV